jgi:hypothetical protein
MKKLLVIFNSLTLLAVIIVNALGGSGQIAGRNVGEVSRQYDTLFAPAGYAFSIWGIIYLMLFGFAGFQWYALLKKKNDDIIKSTGPFFILANLANIAWMFLWLNEFIGLSVLAMLLLLSSLIALTLRLKLEMWDAPLRILSFVWWPIAVYLGWIIVATVANIAAFLVSLSWEGFLLSPQAWAIIMIAIATAIYLTLIFTRNLREAAVVGIWALIAIAIKQWGNYLEITITAVFAAFILLSAILIHAWKNRYFSPKEKIKRGEF